MKKLLLGALCTAGLLAGIDTSQAATVTINGVQYATNVTWYATNVYVLTNYNYVLSNATLTIEPGTVIKGAPGAAPNFGALFICRSGKIDACGTRQNPIIFTALADDVTDPFDLALTAANRGLWGGVVLLGRGIMNEVDCTSTGGTNPDGSLWQVYEGLSASATNIVNGQPLHHWGGNDNNDSSGCMRYVSIRHAGKLLESAKELNGLSMAGCGRGTTVEFCDVYQGADDGFEFWGGAVNTRYLAVYSVDDDMFDMDLGHMGHHQFWFGMQSGTTMPQDKGFELNGQANTCPIAANVQPFGKYQIYNATLIGEGGPAGASDAIVTRDEPYAQVFNSVATLFDGRDQAFSGGANNSVVLNNHFFANATGNGVATVGNVRSSDTSNPLLVNIDRTQNNLLDPTPRAGSPVFSGYKPTPVDGVLVPAPYKGAFNVGENWMLGWTALAANEHLPVPGGTTVTINGVQYTTNVTWYATNVYVLTNYNYVLSNATLTIEAGTVIKGAPGAAPNFGALYICRGGKINAVGTPAAPIIFTALADDVADPFDLAFTAANRGLWGGVVLLGKGILNEVDCTSTGGTNPDGSLWQVYEGLSASAIGVNGQALHHWGGSDNNDNSGVMKYVSIRHAGKLLESAKELNGLSMGGVGRGTTIEYIDVYQGADDGFEFWGGAVDTRYLAVASVDDDMFDMDLGHVGNHQFWFGIQSASMPQDKGFELNGQANTCPIAGNVQPFGKYQIFNATLIGEGGAAGASDAIVTRDQPYAQVFNSVALEFQGRDQAFSGGTNFSVVLNNHFFANATGNGVATVGNVRSSDASNPLLASTDRGQNNLLDPRPSPASPVYSGWRTPPVNGHYDQTAFKGAFDQDLWIAGWSALADNEHLTKDCCDVTKAPLPSAAAEVAVDSSDNVTLSWTAASGLFYQVQRSTDLVNWANVGSLQQNTTETNVVQTYADSITGVGTKKHFRVITSK